MTNIISPNPGGVRLEPKKSSGTFLPRRNSPNALHRTSLRKDLDSCTLVFFLFFFFFYFFLATIIWLLTIYS